jgi:hypothetical protein
MNYARRLLREWNISRVVRIIAGLPIFIYGVHLKEWSLIFFGAAFLAAGLFSTQDCSAGCYTALPRKRPESKPVEFEEVK